MTETCETMRSILGAFMVPFNARVSKEQTKPGGRLKPKGGDLRACSYTAQHVVIPWSLEVY